MLTRLKVSGFKNLLDVDVSFGPFTCIAGLNGVGKSNLFDAITFLSALADRPLAEAAEAVQRGGRRSPDAKRLFFRHGDQYAEQMTFEAEMIVPRKGVDDLGQEAEASFTFLTYRLELGRRANDLEVRWESLRALPREALGQLAFEGSPGWWNSTLRCPEARVTLIHSVMVHAGDAEVQGIVVVQDPGVEATEDSALQSRARLLRSDSLPRTVLSTANANDSVTALLARREMQAWRTLTLEPSALREPDSLGTRPFLGSRGEHLPATLARLAHQDSQVFIGLANRLSELTEGVRSLAVDADERRELLTLLLTDRHGTVHEARALSDGTLRFLALAALEADPEALGLVCLEEPENGIHPQRVLALLRLLQDIAVDPRWPVDPENPLRQVIINTHSPLVAANVPQESLLVAVPLPAIFDGQRTTSPGFLWLPKTRRAELRPEVRPVPLGTVLNYLNPLESEGLVGRRVVDHPGLEPHLPAVGVES